ncbi:MAG TPA: uracil-DNA glycosylase, partial [Achromobacter sp.]|nr:uracil-DNA glycosylase [Achromobacter sp.]
MPIDNRLTSNALAAQAAQLPAAWQAALSADPA